jgi:hypothetical protein
MVTVDAKGAILERRYMANDNAVTPANWAAAPVYTNASHFRLDDVKWCDVNSAGVTLIGASPSPPVMGLGLTLTLRC